MHEDAAKEATAQALKHGRALLKFISANDAGVTGSHQCGFYLPVGAWEMFTPQPPENGLNHKHPVDILWPNDLVTKSVVTWYGNRTRHEYRLTRFGRGFPFLTDAMVGCLLVLIPVTKQTFSAYVLERDEDIDEIQAALGVEVIDAWGVYDHGKARAETEDECLARRFHEFAEVLREFPSGEDFSTATRAALDVCVNGLKQKPLDTQLLKSIDCEYRLFREVERKLCEPQIGKPFSSVDDFLKAAASLMNRRKSRAGRSFENHVGSLLKDAGVPFEARPKIDGRPDIVIPNVAAYEDPSYPDDRLFIVGLKTTCKDRWRQVLNEGKRVQKKHLLTLQRGVSTGQLTEMKEAGLQLVVPAPIQRDYPKKSPMFLQSFQDFAAEVRQVHG